MKNIIGVIYFKNNKNTVNDDLPNYWLLQLGLNGRLNGL